MKPKKVKALAHYGKSNLTEDTLRACSKLCVTKEVSCPKQNSDCRHWINYEQDYNCTLIAVNNATNYSLREVADRLGISFVRVKQIEDKALKKISHLLKDEAI